MLPVGYKTKHTFYISETPSKLEIGETPVYVETSSMDNKIFITITAVPEGVTDIQIPLSINNQPEQHFYVNIEGIPANNEWHAPALKCTSVEEGVQLSVQAYCQTMYIESVEKKKRVFPNGFTPLLTKPHLSIRMSKRDQPMNTVFLQPIKNLFLGGPIQFPGNTCFCKFN